MKAIRLDKDEDRGGSKWRRFKHVLGYNHWYHFAGKKFLQKLHNKRKPKLICNDPDELQRLLDDKQDHMNSTKELDTYNLARNSLDSATSLLDSELVNGKSWNNHLVSNTKSRLRKCGSFPPPRKLKDKEMEVWISANRANQESGKPEQLGRTSLVEPSLLDKYDRLFASSFGILQTSNSLKLRKERDLASLPFRRIRSLSSSESINVMQQIDSPRFGSVTNHPFHMPEESIGLNIEDNPDEIVSVGDEVGVNQDGIAGKVYRELIVLDTSGSYNGGEEEVFDMFSSDMNSNSETCLHEVVSASAESQISEGPEEKCSCAKEEDFAIKSNESLKQKFQTPDMSYVIDLLHPSGFNSANCFNGKLYLRDQPLMSPSLFKEMEAFWHKAEVLECYHHKMIFDLVNEVLVQMCDRSFTYYPKALTSCCRVRSFPTGNRLIEDVCGSISSLLRLKSEIKMSTDGIVGRDLEKDDVWMNLQLAGEDVALELEDLIFGDVLDELIFGDLLDELFNA